MIHRYLILIFVAATVLGWWWWQKSSERAIPEVTTPAATEIPTMAPTFASTLAPNNVVPPETKKAVAQKTVTAENPFKEITPTREKFRQEAAENPHDTPQSLQDFASGMAPKMKRAKKDITAARELFPELVACAQSRTIVAVRAMCAENAATLARAYPADFQKLYIELYDSLDPKIRAMLNSNPHAQ